MKKLLIALLLVSSVVKAEAIFQTKNQSGGSIVLTDEKCNNGTGYLAYSMTPNGNTILGCYLADKLYIHIFWREGGMRSYDYNGWYPVEKKPNT